MKFYYYSRISTISQSSQRQLENFKLHGHVTSDNVFIDKVQGNVPFLERPGALKMYDIVTELGGRKTIVVDSVDRCGRDLSEILKMIQLFTDNGINLHSIKEKLDTLNDDGSINQCASLMIGVMGSIAQMERSRIKERTAEGIAIAKAKGKFKGRKPGSTQSNDRLIQKHSVIVEKLKKGWTFKEIEAITGKSSATISKVKKVLVARGEV